MTQTQQTFLSYLCVFIVTLNDELKKVIVSAQSGCDKQTEKRVIC